MSDESFWKFIEKIAGKLRAISGSVRRHSTPKELHGDAWMAVAEIQEKRGSLVNFDDPEDERLIVNKIIRQAKGRIDRRLLTAYSINDDREGATPWADVLAAPDLSPEDALLQRESDAEKARQFKRSYSQAAAYYIGIDNFKEGRAGLAAHLSISKRALVHRLARVEAIVVRQDSVFDGKARIASNFKPKANLPAVWRARPAPEVTEQTQFRFACGA